MSKPTTMMIDDVEYVRKDRVEKKADTFDGMPYMIFRTKSAGVFAGYLESKDGKISMVRSARRLWYWNGAASLSQLAVDGVSKPSDCKFPCEVGRIELIETIERLDCTKKAQDSIQEVKVWKK